MRRLRWALTLVTGLVLVGWGGSYLWACAYVGTYFEVVLDSGVVSVRHTRPSPDVGWAALRAPQTGVHVWRHRGAELLQRLRGSLVWPPVAGDRATGTTTLRTGVTYTTAITGRRVYLWLPAGLLVGVMLAMWLPRMRRRRASGTCRCGYDLTGNDSGTCPECGRAVGARVS